MNLHSQIQFFSEELIRGKDDHSSVSSHNICIFFIYAYRRSLFKSLDCYLLFFHSKNPAQVMKNSFYLIQAVTRCVLWKKVFLEISQNSQENTCARASFLIKLQACNFIKTETLAQVFSCEFCEISKNIFCCRTPLVTTSDSISIYPWTKKSPYMSKIREMYVEEKMNLCFLTSWKMVIFIIPKLVIFKMITDSFLVE